jgi:hypothetical protein
MKEFKIKISGPGFEYGTEISKDLVAHIVGICMRNADNPSAIPSLIAPIQSPASDSSTKESVAEYVHAKGPKRNPDKILAIAGYLVKNGTESFSPEDIKPFFPKIGEPVPANFGRDFRWAVANAWIAESLEGQNLFYVTNTGRKVIESGFSPDAISKTKQKGKAKQPRKAKKDSEE